MPAGESSGGGFAATPNQNRGVTRDPRLAADAEEESRVPGNPVVFVIDDDPSVRKALGRLIRSVGLDVEIFASGRDWLERPLPDGPACLVLDVRLPGSSGLELQQELARLGRDLPIVFITGHGTVPLGVRAMKAGAVDFLEKPFGDQELLDSVHQAIDRDRRARTEHAERAAIQRRVHSLTPREREVLSLLVTGLLNKQIGSELGATEKTIKVHRARVMAKMQAGSVAELVRLTQKVGIHGPPPKGTAR